MSKLELIVPSLELCRLIPEGEFEDTALVWVYDMAAIGKVMPREMVQFEGTWMIAAPTLEELLEEIGKALEEAEEVEDWDTVTITRPVGTTTRVIDTALRRWFKVKGIEVE